MKVVYLFKNTLCFKCFGVRTQLSLSDPEAQNNNKFWGKNPKTFYKMTNTVFYETYTELLNILACRNINNFRTVVGGYINTIKTNFDLNFDLYQAVKQHGNTEKLSIKKAFL